MPATVAFDNSYARLPERFHARVRPTSVAAPVLVQVNEALARDLGFDPGWLSGPDGVEMLVGRTLPEHTDPIATAYAGHQFGNFVPQLGDGRAILLGEVIDRHGRRRDLQLKGSGPTPFSRRGDGRAALGPVLREYLVSEAMAALGIPTTRSLAAALTGEAVLREGPLPGAVLTRIAASHIRVGTFQYFAAREDTEALGLLADHVIARHYPDAANAAEPYRTMLEGIVAAQAGLVARWLMVGFIHGVMNTDNMSVAAETIDYGPCAFMDAYDPAAVFSSIDERGRYAYGNQPRIAHWNLTRLAEAILPLLAEDPERAVEVAREVLATFAPRFEVAYLGGLRAKLGLATEREGDAELAEGFLSAMATNRADFTLAFRRLGTAAGDPARDAELKALFADAAALEAWLPLWRARLAAEPLEPQARRVRMHAVNPAYIPRNHRIEAMIRAAVDRSDFQLFRDLLAVLETPYEDQPGFAAYADGPSPRERVLQTFCGT